MLRIMAQQQHQSVANVCYWKDVWKTLYKLRKSQHLCDVTIIADDHTSFNAHSIILASGSEVFYANLINKEPTCAVKRHELAGSTFRVPSLNKEELRVTLDFIYGVTPVTIADFKKLQKGAEVFGIAGAKTFCTQQVLELERLAKDNVTLGEASDRCKSSSIVPVSVSNESTQSQLPKITSKHQPGKKEPNLGKCPYFNNRSAEVNYFVPLKKRFLMQVLSEMKKEHLKAAPGDFPLEESALETNTNSRGKTVETPPVTLVSQSVALQVSRDSSVDVPQQSFTSAPATCESISTSQSMTFYEQDTSYSDVIKSSLESAKVKHSAIYSTANTTADEFMDIDAGFIARAKELIPHHIPDLSLSDMGVQCPHLKKLAGQDLDITTDSCSDIDNVQHTTPLNSDSLPYEESEIRGNFEMQLEHSQGSKDHNIASFGTQDKSTTSVDLQFNCYPNLVSHEQKHYSHSGSPNNTDMTDKSKLLNSCGQRKFYSAAAETTSLKTEKHNFVQQKTEFIEYDVNDRRDLFFGSTSSQSSTTEIASISPSSQYSVDFADKRTQYSQHGQPNNDGEHNQHPIQSSPQKVDNVNLWYINTPTTCSQYEPLLTAVKSYSEYSLTNRHHSMSSPMSNGTANIQSTTSNTVYNISRTNMGKTCASNIAHGNCGSMQTNLQSSWSPVQSYVAEYASNSASPQQKGISQNCSNTYLQSNPACDKPVIAQYRDCEDKSQGLMCSTPFGHGQVSSSCSTSALTQWMESEESLTLENLESENEQCYQPVMPEVTDLNAPPTNLSETTDMEMKNSKMVGNIVTQSISNANILLLLKQGYSDKLYHCASPNCCHSNKAIESVQSHMYRRHGHGTPNLPCPQCSKAYFSQSQLRAHLKQCRGSGSDSVEAAPNSNAAVAGGEVISVGASDSKPVVSNPVVSNPVVNNPVVSNPVVSTENGKTCSGVGRQYACEDCDHRARTAQALLTHQLRTHGKGKLFSCQDCDFKSPRKKDMQGHMISQHGKAPPGVPVYECGQCAYRCIDKNRFREHQASHSAEKSFVCPECCKGYSTKRGLRNHVKYHSAERPHACRHCEATFKVRAKLRDHIKLVHLNKGEKPFQCGHCGFRASVRGNVNQHIRNTHKGLPVLVTDLQQQRRRHVKDYDYAKLSGSGIEEVKDASAAGYKNKENEMKAEEN